MNRLSVFAMQHVMDSATMDTSSAAQEHFQLHVKLLIARILDNIDHNLHQTARENVYEAFPFLTTHHNLSAGGLTEEIARCEAATDDHLPIRTLKHELNITGETLLFLLAIGIIEEDLQFGALFATLQSPLKSRYPCIGLLNWLLSEIGQSAIDGWTISQVLARHGLVKIKHDEDAPHLEWTLRVPLPVWSALRGQIAQQPTQNIQRNAAYTFPALSTLILPDELRTQIEQLSALLQHRQLDALILRGMVGAGRRTIIGSLAREFRQDVLLLEKSHDDDMLVLGVLATLTHAIPVIRLDANPGESIAMNHLPGYRGVVGITMGRTGGLSGDILNQALTLTIPAPTYHDRAQFWQAADCPIDEEHLEAITDQFLLTGGRIRRVTHLAAIQMQIAGRSHITVNDVQHAMRSMNRQALETLATPLTPIADWNLLVVSPQIADSLQMLKARCRMREHLLDHVGAAFDYNLNRGVRALFSGPSGTGKTFAVRALAGALNMDVYRVDLAGIVNKYIGETEKNLNRVFTYAEELDVLLLLDEGDSLMTKRTDVSGANDRYANLETNFLLQRLENYEGIIVVTTNAAQRIDDAFVRRLDVVVDFTRPNLPQRRLLWDSHLPANHSIDAQFLEHIVQRCEVTGGQIRNIALNAALIALNDDHYVSKFHLDDALRREYQKASLPYPLANRL